MHGSTPSLNRIALLLISACLLISCKAKPKVVVTPPKAVVPEALIQQHLAQGDAEFSKQHLYGWRQAEAAYTRAYQLDKRDSIHERILLTRLLIATREEDEDVPGRGLDDIIQDLCLEPLEGRRKAICEIARSYRQGFGAAFWRERTDRPAPLDASLFAISESPLEAYLYTLYSKVFGTRAEWNAANNPYEKFKDSPLFIYFTLGPDTLKKIGDPEKAFPDFAELLAFVAEVHFQNQRYKEARAYFSKVLTLVPDYTRANNGLANIYLFVLEDYDNALKTYEATLKRDPWNTAALFGKGASLHHLGSFEESISVLETMLGTDLTRKGRTSDLNVRYYRGEGRYFQAYDYHLLRQPEQARAHIDLAKKDLPESPEINYLSGLLYFNENRLEEATQDFVSVLRVAPSSCYANYYLGLIYANSNQDRMLTSFIGTASCLVSSINNLEKNIQHLATLDVEAGEREALRGKLTKRLTEYRASSIELVVKMTTLLTELQSQKNWKTQLNFMNRLLADLRATTAK